MVREDAKRELGMRRVDVHVRLSPFFFGVPSLCKPSHYCDVIPAAVLHDGSPLLR